LEVILFKLLFRDHELGVLLDEEGSGCLGSLFAFTRRMLFVCRFGIVGEAPAWLISREDMPHYVFDARIYGNILQMAAHQGNPEIPKMLLNRGVDETSSSLNKNREHWPVHSAREFQLQE
jgi:hypothetical protein